MGTTRNRFNLPINLIESIDIVGEEFEVAPAELLRIGAMEPLNLHPISDSSGKREVIEIFWPDALRRRLLIHARQAGCPLETLVENILWAVVRGFPSQFKSPIRENQAGLDRLKECLASSDWW